MQTFYEAKYTNIDGKAGDFYFSPIAGEPVSFPGFEDFFFFIHEIEEVYTEDEDGPFWIDVSYDIHEAETGHLIAEGAATRESAMRIAYYNLLLKKDELADRIREVRKTVGTSPLFRNR